MNQPMTFSEPASVRRQRAVNAYLTAMGYREGGGTPEFDDAAVQKYLAEMPSVGRAFPNGRFSRSKALDLIEEEIDNIDTSDDKVASAVQTYLRIKRGKTSQPYDTEN